MTSILTSFRNDVRIKEKRCNHHLEMKGLEWCLTQGGLTLRACVWQQCQLQELPVCGPLGVSVTGSPMRKGRRSASHITTWEEEIVATEIGKQHS